MTDPRMTPTNDAPVTVDLKDRYANDQLAELIYNSWSEQPGWVPWRERGNSNMQEKARRDAERSIGSALATADDRREALALIARGVLGVDIGKAFAKAGDTFDLPIAVDCVADALARTRLAALASAPAGDGEEATCRQCDGEGEHEHPHMPVHTLQSECPEYAVVTCEECHGTGSIPVEEPGDYLRDRMLSIARICEGKGLLVEASGLRDIASIVSEQFKKWIAR